MNVLDHLFFSIFDSKAARHLADIAERRLYEPGAVIFEEGDDSDSIYLVLSGAVELRKSRADGNTEKIAEVQPNAFFGEFGVLDKGTRSARAVACSASELARVPREEILAYFTDCTGQTALKMAIQIIKKVRETNQRHVEELLRLERLSLLGRAVGGIVHDFRNPFAVISMATECLQRECVGESAEPYCRMILEQLQRVTAMTDDVMDFTRGNTNLNMAPLSTKTVLGRFKDLFEAYLKEQRVVFHLEAEPCMILGDEQKLMRVLQNIVNNAMEAFAGKPGEIRIFQDIHEDRVTIHISDNGPGIPESIRGRMFEAFATAGKKNGLGLGMAIAHSFVAAHEGRLTFDTETGKGTRFHITLPRLRA